MSSPFDAAWSILKAGFVNYDQGFSGFTPETTAMLPQQADVSAYDGGQVMPMVTDFNAARQPRPVPQRGQYNDEAAAMFGQGYQSLPMTLEDSLTQAQQNAYAQGNEPQSYGKLEMMNPFNKDPNVLERKRLGHVAAAKDMYTRVTPIHRQRQGELDRAGGIPVQQLNTERAANAFARANQ